MVAPSPSFPDAACLPGWAADADGLPVIDLRSLPAPEPLIRALDAAGTLAPGEAVHVLTPLQPIPLFEILDARGLLYAAWPAEGGGARILIQNPAGHGKAGD